MAPKISILVPVYNTEPYLKRCLDSLQGQTLPEIEIVLIDDGSTDGSGAICDAYAASDPRFVVIHQENAGISSARNCGLELAKAEYIMLADSDDWVEPDFCRIPYEIAERDQADLVIFRYRKTGFTTRRNGDSPEREAGEKTVEQALTMLVDTPEECVAWDKLYRKSLFQSVRYAGRVHEDTRTTHRMIAAAKRIVFTNDILYHYCGRPGSIVETLDPQKRKIELQAYLEFEHALRERGSIHLADRMLARYGIEYLAKYGANDEIGAAIAPFIKKDLRKQPGIPRKRRIMLWIYQISPKLFDFLCILLRLRTR